LPTSYSDDQPIPVIVGRCLSKHVILLDCQVMGWTETSGGPDVRPILHAGNVLVGNRSPDSESEISFNRADLRFSRLNEWANRRPYENTRKDGMEAVILKQIEPLSVELPDATITLWRCTTTRHGFLDSFTWDSAEQLRFEFRQPLSIEMIFDAYARPLGNLLTLAAGALAELTYLEVSLVEDGQDPFEAASYEVALRPTHDSSHDVHPTQFRFTLDDNSYNATMDFAHAVRCWFDLDRELTFVCDLAFSLYHEEAGFLESQMFNAASAAEGLHRAMVARKADEEAHEAFVAELTTSVPDEHRGWLKEKLKYAYEPSFPERLHELIDYAGPAVEYSIGNRRRWISRVAAARNGLAHPGAKSRRDPLKLVRLEQTTRMLVEVVLLRELGFGEEACEKMVKQDPHWRHLAAEMPHLFPDLFKQGRIPKR